MRALPVAHDAHERVYEREREDYWLLINRRANTRCARARPRERSDYRGGDSVSFGDPRQGGDSLSFASNASRRVFTRVEEESWATRCARPAGTPPLRCEIRRMGTSMTSRSVPAGEVFDSVSVLTAGRAVEGKRERSEGEVENAKKVRGEGRSVSRMRN